MDDSHLISHHSHYGLFSAITGEFLYPVVQRVKWQLVWNIKHQNTSLRYKVPQWFILCYSFISQPGFRVTDTSWEWEITKNP